MDIMRDEIASISLAGELERRDVGRVRGTKKVPEEKLGWRGRSDWSSSRRDRH